MATSRSSLLSFARYTSPHPARAEGRKNFVRAELSAGGERHIQPSVLDQEMDLKVSRCIWMLSKATLVARL
jgi:hypothetical protein